MSEPKSIADLKSDPHNRRKHNPRNIGMIRQALGEVGAARSIVIDERGVVLAGNGVLEAAADAGIERVQVVDADGETIIAVRRTGLSEEQKRKLALYDNRTAELATWDGEQLAADLEAGLSFDGLFSNDELQAIMEHAADEQLADERRAKDMLGTLSVDGYDLEINAAKLGYRLEAVCRCPRRERALELFAGRGQLSYWYGRLFDEVVRIDNDPRVEPDIIAKAEQWLVSDFDPGAPFDLVDFDDEGCPSEAIQKFFHRIRDVRWPPFVLCLTDGFGLNLKARGRANLQKSYRFGEAGTRKVNSTDLYEAFPALVEHHLQIVAEEAGYLAERISLTRGTRGNVDYACYTVTPATATAGSEEQPDATATH